MCYVTSTELKQNLSHYLELSKSENVFVTKNNKVISVLVSPQDRGFFEFMELRGCLKTNDEQTDYKEIIAKEILDR